MREQAKGVLARFSAALRAAAPLLWAATAIVVPLAILVGFYTSALLLLICAVFWQFLSSLLTALVKQPRQEVARRWCGYRVTTWGLVYGGVTLTVSAVSIGYGINLAYLTAAFLLSAGACAVVLPGLVVAGTDARWEAPARAVASSPFTVEVRLRNRRHAGLGFSPCGLQVTSPGPSHQVRHGVRRIAPGAERRLSLRHYLPERGLRKLPALKVSSRFPLGVVEASAELCPEQEVLVLPRMGRINPERVLRYLGSEAKWLVSMPRKDEQGEFRSLREYRYGDNPRHIHWTTSARLSKLYVREFEQRQMHGVLILLDCFAGSAGAGDDDGWHDRFEKAISFVATLATVLTERGIFYSFAACCPSLQSLPYDTGLGHLNSLLELLALADTTPDKTISDVAAALSLPQVRTGGIWVVTPGPLARLQLPAGLGQPGDSTLVVDVSEAWFDEIFSF